MAEPIRLKLIGIVERSRAHVQEEFFRSVKVDRDQVGGPQVPLLGCGNDKETPI